VGVSSEAVCTGIEACLIFTTAVLVYPASWQMRMTGVGLGFVAIQSVNVLRIIVLFYLAGQGEVVFRFAHLYLWQALVMLDVLVVCWCLGWRCGTGHVTTGH